MLVPVEFYHERWVVYGTIKVHQVGVGAVLGVETPWFALIQCFNGWSTELSGGIKHTSWQLPSSIYHYFLSIRIPIDICSINQLEWIYSLILPNHALSKHSSCKLSNTKLYPWLIQHFSTGNVVLLLHSWESVHQIRFCFFKCEHSAYIHVQQLEQ